jgi:hypothetical protein
MPKNPTITHVEYDLRQAGPKLDTWVTVHWSVDDEIQIYVGKTDPSNISRDELAEKTQLALRKEAKQLASVSVKAPNAHRT